MLQAQFNYNKKQVQFLTGLTPQLMQNFITATAMDWLELNFSGAIDCEKLISTTLFMNWWTFHWLTRDDKYILSHLYHIQPQSRLYSYRAAHQYIFSSGTDAETLMLDFQNMFKSFQQAINEPKKVTA